MTILDRYLAKTILTTTLVVIFALMSLDFLGQVFAEIDILGKHQYTITRLLAYVLLRLPGRLLEFFPAALLIGSLMGLGKLADNNELTVYPILGVSRLRIALVGIGMALILGVLVLCASEVGIRLQQFAKQFRSQALGTYETSSILEDVWLQDGQNFIQIGGVLATGELQNVSVYQLDESMQLQRKRFAERARANEFDWQLFNVTEKIISKKSIKTQFFPSQRFINQIDKTLLTTVTVRPRELSIGDLQRLIRYQKNNAVEPTLFLLALWQRLFVPLTATVMFLLALPFVFGHNRNHSQGRKLFAGVLLGLGYYIAYSGLANLVLLLGIPVLLGALLPIIIFLAVALVLLRLS